MTTPKPLAGKPRVKPGPPPLRDWPTIANVLRAAPGVWHEIDHYHTKTNEVWRIKTGQNPVFREGRWDAMCKQVGPDTYVLYAVYEGPDDD